MAVSNEERDKLFRQFRHSLGAPIRQIELTDDQYVGPNPDITSPTTFPLLLISYAPPDKAIIPT